MRWHNLGPALEVPPETLDVPSCCLCAMVQDGMGGPGDWRKDPLTPRTWLLLLAHSQRFCKPSWHRTQTGFTTVCLWSQSQTQSGHLVSYIFDWNENLFMEDVPTMHIHTNTRASAIILFILPMLHVGVYFHLYLWAWQHEIEWKINPDKINVDHTVWRSPQWLLVNDSDLTNHWVSTSTTIHKSMLEKNLETTPGFTWFLLLSRHAHRRCFKHFMWTCVSHFNSSHWSNCCVFW